ncbi:MAG: hypothetical protein P4M08_09810 [Oligoflexia bacterium]|nr:hypothetical protein [Oligoflexia bacterium]
MSKQSVIKASDFKDIEKLRGELMVQSHLFKAEAREQFERMEKEWKKLDAELRPAISAASKATQEVGAATQLLADSLREGYGRIKKSLNLH